MSNSLRVAFAAEARLTDKIKSRVRAPKEDEPGEQLQRKIFFGLL